MDTYSCTDEDQFFDTLDTDLGSDSSEGCSSPGLRDSAPGFEYRTEELDSVNERRKRFLRWMSGQLDCQSNLRDEEDYLFYSDVNRDIDRLRDDGEAVLANLHPEPKLLSSSLLPTQSDSTTDSVEEDNQTWRIKNLDSGTEFIMDELGDDGTISRLREVGSENIISFHEFQKSLSSSEFVQQLLRKHSTEFHMDHSKRKEKHSLIHKFSNVSHISNKTKGPVDKHSEAMQKPGSANQRIHVHVSKKHHKELSSVHRGQEFPAHEGSILTMKFSPDGQYLASSGVDGVVRIWKVLQNDVVTKFIAQDLDPSCLYFSLNSFSKLSPLGANNEKKGAHKSSKLSSNSPCAVLPPEAFHLTEQPLHEFHGHEGEVLALSWSRNGHLLSTSVDKSARLWRVEHDDCLGVYPHNNYVTCVDFNPVDDNYFISGSIDGILRVWDVEGGRVIDWIDIRGIVTAACYRPDGKGGVLGSMNGNCRFFDIIDNRLQLGAEICLKRKKKKLPGKRITGFQYCPGDASKIMVTSADSKVRIIRGNNIICKFKGGRTSGSQVPASFTTDGEHIVAASSDSNVRVWNYTPDNPKSSHQPKKVWSCESFLSQNTSIAIPWCGLKNKLVSLPGNILGNRHFDDKLLQKLPAFPDCFVTSLGFFLDSLHKGSSTWPEEKLLRSNAKTAAEKQQQPARSIGKSEFKLLKNAWQSSMNGPHMWGLVIVTAGWDGCIRTFLNYGLPVRL